MQSMQQQTSVQQPGGAQVNGGAGAAAAAAAPLSPGSALGGRQQISGGRFDFEDGGTYCGGWEEGKAHGHGVCTGPKHQGAYSGAWNYGFEVSGVYIWPSGSSFEGQWQNGRRHGLGVETRGRWIYRGEWTSGAKGRYGVRQSVTSTAKYEGTWAGGFQDGYGSETYADGGTYQGQWLSGKRHGYGVRQSAPFGLASHYRPKTLQASMTSLRSNEGDKNPDPADKRNHRIDDVRGGFVLKARSDEAPARRNSLVEKTKKGLLSGLKIRKQRSTGDLEKRGTGASGSIRSTVSTASWISTGSSQSGMTTKSMHTDSNASFTVEEEQLDPSVTEVYMGEWKHDKRDGYGISERSDGLRYEGEWHNNKKHGYGVTTFRDGTREEGKYKCNVLITSQKKKHVFLIRSAKFRERIEAAVSSAQRASKYALQKADIAISRTATARGKAELADQHSELARVDSDVAVATAREFAPDFKPTVCERFDRLRTRERPRPPTEPPKIEYLRSEQFTPKRQPSEMLSKKPNTMTSPTPQQPTIPTNQSQTSTGGIRRPSLQHQQQVTSQPSFDYSTSGNPVQMNSSSVNKPNDIMANNLYSPNSQLQQQPNPGYNNRYQMGVTSPSGPSSIQQQQQLQQEYPNNSSSPNYPPFNTNYGQQQQQQQLQQSQLQQQQQQQIPQHQYQQQNYMSSNVSTGSGNQLYGLNNSVAPNKMNYYNQQQQQPQPPQQQQPMQQQMQKPSIPSQMQSQSATNYNYQSANDYYSNSGMTSTIDQQQQQPQQVMDYEMPSRSGSTSIRRNSRLVSDSNRPMLGSYNQNSSIDHFDHYKRPPSRDSSVDRYTRAASRLGGVGSGFGGSRQASVDRTLPPVQPQPSMETPDRNSRAGSAFRQLPPPSSTTGNGTVMTGAGGGSRSGTPVYQVPNPQPLYSSPNQPFEDVLLRQRTLGQDIVPSPAQPKRTESLYIGAKAAPAMGGGGMGGGGGGGGGGKGLKSVPINVQLQRKKSLPDVQELPIRTGMMSREEVSALGSARREEVRRQIENSERLKANPLLYLVSPQVKDWFSRQQLVMLVLIVNIALGIMFFKMLT